MKKIIKKLLPRRLIDYILSLIWKRRFLKMKKEQGCSVFLLQTPVHSNLGDHAIAYAELLLLQNLSVIEITDYQLNILLKFPDIIRKIIGDCEILITGGGNLGTLWISIEENIRRVLELFSENRIIILPQSAYYEDSDYGKEELENAKRIYNACTNLTITAREKTSYAFLKQHFRDVQLFPDMVLSLGNLSFECKRSGLLMMLRQDGERVLDTDFNEKIAAAVKNIGLKVTESDMLSVNKKISVERREAALMEKFRQFASAELVVTDRLHAMIFSVITGTPCAVLPCKSPKVKGIYDWLLSGTDYVHYIDNPDEIVPFWERVKDKRYSFNNDDMIPYFQQLVDLIERK